ncbi:MAG TPA: DUF4328 domain-containing protein [Hyphomonadaceae bacterium]|nr:DUF4328 domain-containing protein [Hyphomonadaceae bacterium]
MTDDMLQPDNALPYDPDEDREEAEPTKPLRPVLRLLRWAIGAFIIGQAANAAIAAAYVMNLVPTDIAPAPISALGPLDSIVAVVFSATLVFAAACYFRFIYRAMANLKKYSERHIQDSPLGSVVWHFVPGIGWIKPYSIMRLLWVRSHNPASRGEEPSPPGALGGWWLLWLGVNITALYSAALQQGAYDPDTDPAVVLRAMSIASILSSLCAIASSLLLLPVVKDITDAQDIIEKAEAFRD